jgi:hypothetical protein
MENASHSIIRLPCGGGGRLPLDDVFEEIRRRGGYMIIGKATVAYAKHPKRYSLDYFLRRYATNVNVMQATDELLGAICSTGKARLAVDYDAETDRMCRSIRLADFAPAQSGNDPGFAKQLDHYQLMQRVEQMEIAEIADTLSTELRQHAFARLLSKAYNSERCRRIRLARSYEKLYMARRLRRAGLWRSISRQAKLKAAEDYKARQTADSELYGLTVARGSEADAARVSLVSAIREYAFPRCAFNFSSSCEISFPSMSSLESFIQTGLRSANISAVEDGLSNVLYWGYSNSPERRDDRVKKFRSKTHPDQIRRAMDCFKSLHGSGLRELQMLGLPEFSNLSFLTKLRTFLNPESYCVIDLKLLNIPTLGNKFKAGTSIRVTPANRAAYDWWVDLCQRIANSRCVEGPVRAVDVERGFFHLVATKRAAIADSIIRQFNS